MKIKQDASTVKILLVDDEAIVRKTCQRILSRIGFEVIGANSGQEAVALYRKHWKSISVVLLDMIMPEMNGSATLAQLREVNPSARVILSSGYPRDDVIESLTQDHFTEFMRKPYQIQELVDTVHRVSIQA
ncbi:MAG: response regulator [Deltaproteobacteria bacterium]|nr:response regulator [Deltaproteobacteria bacterium]